MKLPGFFWIFRDVSEKHQVFARHHCLIFMFDGLWFFEMNHRYSCQCILFRFD